MLKNIDELLLDEKNFVVTYKVRNIKKQSEDLRTGQLAVIEIHDNNLLLSKSFFDALMQNKKITELRFLKPLNETQIKVLHGLIDDNTNLLKIQIANLSLPLVNHYDAPHFASLSANLVFNQKIRALGHVFNVAEHIDTTSSSVVIKDSRMLLSKDFVNALAKHPIVQRVIIMDSITLKQATNLLKILAHITSIHNVSINGTDMELCTDDRLNNLMNEILTFNLQIAKIRAGEATPLRAPNALTKRQEAAIIKCLAGPHKISKLTLPAINPAIFEAIGQNSTLHSLHFNKDLANNECGPLKKLLDRNISIYEITCLDATQRLDQGTPISHNSAILAELHTNKIYNAIGSKNATIFTLEGDYVVSDHKTLLIAEKLATCPYVRSVLLSGCKISALGLSALFKALTTTQIRQLSISYILLTPRHFEEIFKLLLKPSHITILKLIATGMTDAQMPALANLLKSNPHLSVLNVFANAIGDEGINTLCNALATNIR
ncbi:MAG: hypothetical protein M3R00_07705, partial [Pseudomonadota bacterium]|nr:hypothetical protein [Pseudomonadota bacterium]